MLTVIRTCSINTWRTIAYILTMPQRQTKFSETWLSSVDSNGQRIGEWCRKGQNEYQAYCQFCDVQVKCDNAGKTQLLQHSKQKKHIDVIKHSVDKKQKLELL